MKRDDAEEYTAALGQVVGGGYRQVALGVRLGVPKALGLTTKQWVEDRLGGYVRLSVKAADGEKTERQLAVEDLAAEGMTQREIADVLGVGVGTVNRELAGVPDGTADVGDQGEATPIVPSGTPSWIDTFEAPPAPELPKPSANDSLGTDEYFTPRWVFDRLGLDFDLDVAAPPGGAPHVPAARYFTAADDGLTQDWIGRVWMNPPYSAPGPWVARFLDHGDGIALLPFAKSDWFFDLWAAEKVTLVAPGIRASRFEGGQIQMATFLAAVGPEDVHKAVQRLGVAR